MSFKNQSVFKVAETYTTADGLIVANFERNCKDPTKFERFLAFQCFSWGIAEILGYKTTKTIGIGDGFSCKSGEFLRKVSIQKYGFQK